MKDERRKVKRLGDTDSASRKKLPAKKVTRKKVAPEPIQVVESLSSDASPIAQATNIIIDATPSSEVVTPDLSVLIYERPDRLLVLTLILGWGINYLFWKQSVGINFAIALIISLIGGIFWLYSHKLSPSRNSLWLLIPFVFFAVVASLRQEPLTIFLAYTFTLLAAGLFASSYLGGRWVLYGLLDYFYKSILLVAGMFLAPFDYFPKAGKNQNGLTRRFDVWGILRGLAIALPIVLCFGSLLASGDVVFGKKVRDLFDGFNMQKVGENVAQLILVVVYAHLLTGSYLYAALKSRDAQLIGEEKPVIKPFLGVTESAVLLGSVSILFLAFVIVQFQYFFGGQTNIGVEGYTYSQYARRGFNELITVAFFSLVMILGLSSIAKREGEKQKKVYSWLSVILVALVLVILVSAYQRISLSIGWHGFSRLRLYPRIFLIWLAMLLVTVVVLEILRGDRYFAFAAVLASVGFAVSLVFINVDAATVRHNIPRTLQGKNLNVGHLASLSVDAVPALVESFYSDAYPENIHEGIGVILACYLYYDSKPGAYQDDWRSFNLSRWRAHKALDDVEPYLQTYGIREDNYPLQIRTPSNVVYDCKEYGNQEE